MSFVRRFCKFFFILFSVLAFPIVWMFPAKLACTRLRLVLQGLPQNLNNTRIVHLTDFHWDSPKPRVEASLLNQAIEISNFEDPHLVLLTGDYVQKQPEPVRELVQYLKGLKSKNGVYAVLGNHDAKVDGGREMITNVLGSVGIKVLKNESLHPVGPGLELIGLGDWHSGDFRPEKVFGKGSGTNGTSPEQESYCVGQREEDFTAVEPRIVITHNPDCAQLLQRYRVDLQLSGHSHGGQIQLPFIGPLIPVFGKMLEFLPVSWRHFVPGRGLFFGGVVKNWEWGGGGLKKTSLWSIGTNEELTSSLQDAGSAASIGGNLLYTNRGLATHPPLRLFCDPEIVLITLVSADVVL